MAYAPLGLGLVCQFECLSARSYFPATSCLQASLWALHARLICSFIWEKDLQRIEQGFAKLLSLSCHSVLSSLWLVWHLFFINISYQEGMSLYTRLFFFYDYHHTYNVICLCSGVWSSNTVLWTLSWGEPVWATVLTARSHELWSWT